MSEAHYLEARYLTDLSGYSRACMIEIIKIIC